jgi:GTPase SAR1 family protein
MDQKPEIRKKHIKKSSKGKQFDFTFKIVMIGDSGVGKSCILLRFADDKFCENFYATIGVDFRFKNLIVDDKHVKLQIVSYIYKLYFYFNINSGIQQVKKNLKQ